MKLIIATKNKGKFKEIKKLLKGLPITLVSLKQLPRQFTIKEDGKTFLDNARKKALAVSRYYPDDLVVGEDSGLSVLSLGGKPGVHSKRYSGKSATDKKNNTQLLKALGSLPRAKRAAYFQCTIVLAQKAHVIGSFRGELSGFIYTKAKGRGGFGYDPVFYVPRLKKTVAQLPLYQKNKISHRFKAFRRLKKFLANYL